MGETQLTTIPVAVLEAKGLRPDGVPPSPLVLVVDDECNIADSMAAILRKAGYAAIAVYDAESALQLALIAPPQVVVTDVCMPGMSGLELAVQLRESVPGCEVVLFSALYDTFDIDECAGCASKAGHQFTLFTKPVAPKTLLDELRRLAPPTGSDPDTRNSDTAA